MCHRLWNSDFHRVYVIFVSDPSFVYLSARFICTLVFFCQSDFYFLFLQLDSAGVDADIQREYARQREHLERSVASLRKKLAKDSEIHRADNVRIMQVCH